MMLRMAVLRAAKAPLEKVLTEEVGFLIHFYGRCPMFSPINPHCPARFYLSFPQKKLGPFHNWYLVLRRKWWCGLGLSFRPCFRPNISIWHKMKALTTTLALLQTMRIKKIQCLHYLVNCHVNIKFTVEQNSTIPPLKILSTVILSQHLFTESRLSLLAHKMGNVILTLAFRCLCMFRHLNSLLCSSLNEARKLLLQNETVKVLSITALMMFWIGNKTDQRKQPLQSQKESSHGYHI